LIDTTVTDLNYRIGALPLHYLSKESGVQAVNGRSNGILPAKPGGEGV